MQRLYQLLFINIVILPSIVIRGNRTMLGLGLGADVPFQSHGREAPLVMLLRFQIRCYYEALRILILIVKAR